MKITIIGPAYPYRGGIALFSDRLAESLFKAGHEVNIITFSLQYPGFLFPGKTQFSTDKNIHHIPTVRTINSINPFNWIKVGKQLKKAQPDLVIFKYWMPFMAPCFGTIAKKIRKNKVTKIIAVVHNLMPHERHTGDCFLSKYFMKYMDGFIAMSESVLHDLSSFDRNKPKVFSPHPLYDNFGIKKSKEEALKSLGLDTSCYYMLFFGIIRKYKGLDLLLEAFADKRLNNGKIKLIVAGEFYEDNASYLELIRKNKLQDAIILVNHFIPDTEVVNYFCAADIVVQPYKHATQSGVTQIAYHFDKPMLVTDVGGLKEIVPHQKAGYVVQPDATEITAALADFYENNREEEFVRGVISEKNKYSWENMVDTINTLYKDVQK